MIHFMRYEVKEKHKNSLILRYLKRKQKILCSKNTPRTKTIVVNIGEKIERIEEICSEKTKSYYIFSEGYPKKIQKNWTVFVYFSKNRLIQKAIDQKCIPREGSSYCDFYFFMENISEDLLEKRPGIYTLVTGTVPEKNHIESYFGEKFDHIYDPSPKVFSSFILKIQEKCLFSSKKKINIFVPTYYRFKKAYNCLNSLMNSIKKSKHTVNIYIGDNNTKNQKMLEWLKKQNLDVYFSSKNIGKSQMVNKLFKDHQDCDYIFSIDSDLVVPEDINSIDGMIEVLERVENCGIVSSFQTGESQHWFGKTVFPGKEGSYSIGESINGIGVAGGCICIRKEDWEKIGMYEENYDIYTADDAILMEKIENILGKRSLISMDYPLYHPSSSEDDKGYVEWKRNRFLKDGFTYKKGYQKKYYGKGFYD